jgi:hypothetical protein
MAPEWELTNVLGLPIQNEDISALSSMAVVILAKYENRTRTG